jgi:hypothetical protein
MGSRKSIKDIKHQITDQLQIMELQLDLICSELKTQRDKYVKLSSLIRELGEDDLNGLSSLDDRVIMRKLAGFVAIMDNLDMRVDRIEKAQKDHVSDGR